jgi:hypothetical protein
MTFDTEDRYTASVYFTRCQVSESRCGLNPDIAKE